MDKMEDKVRSLVTQMGGEVVANKLQPFSGGHWDILIIAPDGMTWDGKETEIVCSSWLIAFKRVNSAIKEMSLQGLDGPR